VHPAPPAAAGADYAGFVTRALAFGIDAVTVSVVGAGVGAIVGLALSLLSVPSGISDVLAALAGVAFLVCDDHLLRHVLVDPLRAKHDHRGASSPPERGEHTAELLHELGRRDAEIAALAERGAVALGRG
jgi:hypothetical protein